MKIISYNVNGIRAAINKGFVDWLKEADPDIVLIQETKAHQEQIYRVVPEKEEQILLLDPKGEDIADPYGCPVDIYRQTAKKIKECLVERMGEV